MALAQKTTPYEFLVRWDDAGNLQGAHMLQRSAIVDDTTGAEVKGTSSVTDPQPVALTDANLLASIAGQINASSLAQITTLQQQASDAQAAQKTAQDSLAAAQAQLAQYIPSTDASGVPVWVWSSQAALAMIALGIQSKVEAWLATLTGQDGDFARAWYQRAVQWRRDHQVIASAISAGVFTSEEVDDLFELAATYAPDGSMPTTQSTVAQTQTGLIAKLKSLLGLA